MNEKVECRILSVMLSLRLHIIKSPCNYDITLSDALNSIRFINK